MDGNGSNRPRDDSSRNRCVKWAIEECYGSGKSGNVRDEVGDGCFETKCGSGSVKESMDEMVPEGDTWAAEVLMVMRKDVSGWSKYLDSFVLRRGLSDHDKIANDEDEDDDDDMDVDDTDIEDDIDYDDGVGNDDESGSDCSDDDVDESLESSALKGKEKAKMLWKERCGSLRVDDGIEGSPIGLFAKDRKPNDKNLEDDSLKANDPLEKVYGRRKYRNGGLCFGTCTKEERMEQDDNNKRCKLVEASKVIVGLRSRRQKMSYDRHHTKKMSKGRMFSVKCESVMRRDPSKRLQRLNSNRGSNSPNTVQRGTSFSVLHLLFAVREALVTSKGKKTSQICKDNGEGSSGRQTQHNFPWLLLEEIVDQVRSNPGDSRILQYHEPLKVLVRGALKVFSSEEWGNGWTSLSSYRKSDRSWSWIGPMGSIPFQGGDPVDEDEASKAWGLPWKVLLTMVNSFGDWLSNHQEKLQQLEKLSTPPVFLMPSEFNPVERFRDINMRKCSPTINPSSNEVRAYFRKEEKVRYLVPDRSFSYTAIDGRKSMVAPLPMSSWKPPPRARDHVLLKPDRPGNVTLLSVARDAAARLPCGVGTRGDVCTLLRDSQYLMEDISDEQLNLVVSGALDRLHYERDPCVRFDKSRRLWYYLHGERDEDDFKEDGTCSTWKRLYYSCNAISSESVNRDNLLCL
ncbi:hypothetical protein Drorol1_Dr00026148 [Drosera rotundifolia]